MNFNKEQEKVINSSFPIINIAGPGSGKTHTMIGKISLKLVNNEEDLKKLLILTFTNAAANEIFKRIENKIEKELNKKNFYTGTFHGIFYRLLIENKDKLFQTFKFTKIPQILSPSDDQKLFKKIFFMEYDNGEKTQKLINEKIEEIHGKPIMEFYYKISNILQNGIIDTQKIVNDTANYSNSEIKEDLEKLSYIIKKYFIYKIKNNIMNFNDILFYMNYLLQKDKEFKFILQNKFKYILVDEYQDTNIVQDMIINNISKNNNENTFIVCDPYQGIYRFLGANIKNIISKIDNANKNTNIIQLTKNYRSNKNIVEFTNDIVTLFEYKIDNFIPCTSENKNLTNQKIEIEEFSFKQEKNIIIKIKERIKQNIPLSEIAIISRTNFETYSIEKELLYNNIPFNKKGGKGFYELNEVKTILSIVKVLLKDYSAFDFETFLINFDGIGKGTINKLLNENIITNKGFSNIIKNKFPKNKKLQNINNILISNKTLNKEYLLEIINLKELNLKEKFIKKANTISKREEINNNINYLIKELDKKFKSNNLKELQEYLTNVTLDKNKNEVIENAITITTAHSAKGLEWNSCFILNVNEGSFPSEKSLEFQEQLEEEKRLFYVAVSRAKEYLYLSTPKEISSFVTKFKNKNYINFKTNNNNNNNIWN